MKDPAAKIMLGLTEALVLESLRREPKHGYGLLKELEEVFGETPNRNRIYPLLGRLEEEGYVEGRTDPDSSRGKTTYHLTDAGRDRLETYESMPPAFRETLGRFWGATDPAEESDDGSEPEDEGGEADDGSEPEDDGGEDVDDAEPEMEEGSEGSPDDEEDGGDGAGEGSGPGGGGGPEGGEGPPAGGPRGMDLRRNPETGAVEMVIRGTHWGEVRIELGELRDDD